MKLSKIRPNKMIQLAIDKKKGKTRPAYFLLKQAWIAIRKQRHKKILY